MRPRSLRLRALTALAGAVLAAATIVIPARTGGEAAVAEQTPGPILFGASVASAAELSGYESVAGKKIVGYRIYRIWGQRLFASWQLTARDNHHIPFLSLKARRSGGPISFSAIAGARPGSTLYADMVDQARQLKAYGGPVYFIFNHEVDATTSANSGGAAAFIAAWRTLHQVYQAQGATNVRWVWTLTAWAFTTGTAAAYYPGDAYVDGIAADGYNWYTCRSGGGSWQSFATVFDGERRFGLAHPTEKLMIMEFGSTEDPLRPGRKAAWFDAARETLRSPDWAQFSVVLSWNGRNDPNRRTGCLFDYASSASATRAWVDMRDDWFMSTWRVQ